MAEDGEEIYSEQAHTVRSYCWQIICKSGSLYSSIGHRHKGTIINNNNLYFLSIEAKTMGFTLPVFITLKISEAWFSHVVKIPDDRGFSPSQILPIHQIFAIASFSQLYHSWNTEDAMFICVRGTGAQQYRGLVMSEIHRRRTPTSSTVKNLSFPLSGMIAYHRRYLGRLRKRSQFSIFVPVHPTRSGISTISSFH